MKKQKIQKSKSPKPNNKVKSAEGLAPKAKNLPKNIKKQSNKVVDKKIGNTSKIDPKKSKKFNKTSKTIKNKE